MSLYSGHLKTVCIRGWLCVFVIVTKAVKLIRPTDFVAYHPVSVLVNNSRNKSEDCVKPIDPQSVKLFVLNNYRFVLKTWINWWSSIELCSMFFSVLLNSSNC